MSIQIDTDQNKLYVSYYPSRITIRAKYPKTLIIIHKHIVILIYVISIKIRSRYPKNPNYHTNITQSMIQVVQLVKAELSDNKHIKLRSDENKNRFQIRIRT